MSQWFGLVFFGIGMLIYRSTADPTLLWSIIVGIVSMGIGGGLGVLYDLKFGKYNYNIAYFIDNVLWLFVFCVPGLLLGSIVHSISSYLINENWNSESENFTIEFIVMALTTLFLTYKKMRSKQRKRFIQNDFEEL